MSQTRSTSRGGAAQHGRCGGLWAALGAVVFAAALATAFLGFWGSDLRESVPVPSSMLPDGAHPKRRMKPVIEADYRLAVWAVGLPAGPDHRGTAAAP